MKFSMKPTTAADVLWDGRVGGRWVVMSQGLPQAYEVMPGDEPGEQKLLHLLVQVRAGALPSPPQPHQPQGYAEMAASEYVVRRKGKQRLSGEVEREAERERLINASDGKWRYG